jgi:hypothetical protein
MTKNGCVLGTHLKRAGTSAFPGPPPCFNDRSSATSLRSRPLQRGNADVRWQTKARAFSVLSNVPWGEDLHYALQRYVTRRLPRPEKRVKSIYSAASERPGFELLCDQPDRRPPEQWIPERLAPRFKNFSPEDLFTLGSLIVGRPAEPSKGS